MDPSDAHQSCGGCLGADGREGGGSHGLAHKPGLDDGTLPHLRGPLLRSHHRTLQCEPSTLAVFSSKSQAVHQSFPDGIMFDICMDDILWDGSHQEQDKYRKLHQDCRINALFLRRILAA